MSTPTLSNHAIVIGGSIAGLLAARVLLNHFGRVTIVERDLLPDTPTFRLGAPHARHAHALLVRGQEILEASFPGLTAELLAQGAHLCNLGRDLALTIGGVRVKPYDIDLEALGFSRPLLESAIYRRVRALPGVQFVDGQDVVGLCTCENQQVVTGIRLQPRTGTNREIHEISAGLVVDASGRSSKAPLWLQELGYTPPQEITVDAQAGYATRIYRRTVSPASGKVIYAIAQAPQQTRGGLLLPIEGDRWMVTLTGLNGDYPPTDEAGFLAFAKSIPVADFYATICNAEPLSEPYGYRNGANRLRLYDKLPRYLEGFVALGDAVYALNPVYGQGMTVAAIGAQTLDQCLHTQWRQGLPIHKGLARRFQKQLAKVNAGPWQLATAQDMRWPVAAAEHKIDPLTRLMQSYFDRVLTAMIDNGEVAAVFSAVQNMLRPPSDLFHPRIVWQVLRTKKHYTAVIAAGNTQVEMVPSQ